MLRVLSRSAHATVSVSLPLLRATTLHEPGEARKQQAHHAKSEGTHGWHDDGGPGDRCRRYGGAQRVHYVYVHVTLRPVSHNEGVMCYVKNVGDTVSHLGIAR